jgi:transcriptional regulator with XRE-family HTH domain
MATTAANTAIRFLWAVDARDVIARRITGRRKELGLTQQEVAERGHLALRSYQRYERGSVMPRKSARERLVAALELAIGELEPPTEDQTKEEEASTREQLREVLTRLSRIEDLLTERELADLEAEVGGLTQPTRKPGGKRAAGES